MLVGIVGYMIIEGYNFLEAFYMTVITVSTVGFKEVRPLNPVGQLFTSFLIITSFGTFAYTVSALARSVLTGELGHYLKKYRLEKNIDKLNDHVIICGFGRNGRRAAKKLQAFNQNFVIVEQDSSIVEQHLENSGMSFYEGDATLDETLIKVGIERAKAVIATMSKDADNLYTVITARELNKSVGIISRASNDSAEKKLKAVGANNVVMPEGVGGAHMATLVMSPDIVEFLEHISVEGSSNINLGEIEVNKLRDKSGDMVIKDLSIRQRTGCTIIGLKTPEGEYIINPSSDMHLEPHSKLFVLGKPEELEDLHKYLN